MAVLGLETICLPAKRWNGTVGRPIVQAFVGSVEGRRVNKGILICTSDYSKEARDYVETIGKRIVLIDGQQLANLMIDWNLGVSVVALYELKRIDPELFSEE